MGSTKFCDGLRWCCEANISISQVLIVRYHATVYEACDAIWKPDLTLTNQSARSPGVLIIDMEGCSIDDTPVQLLNTQPTLVLVFITTKNTK